MLKYINGKKSLSSAFRLGVFLVLATFLILLILKDQGILFRSRQSFLIISLLIVVPIRLFVWISIIRCSKNSTSNAFRTIAIGLVIVDIISRMFFWGVSGFSMLEHHQIDKKYAAEFELCKNEISHKFQQPIENLYGKAHQFYNSNRPHYEIHTKSRTKTYYCFCEKNSIDIEEKVYSKWYNYTKKADIDGTSQLATISLTPRYLKLAYGPPQKGDGLRVSGIYMFISDADEVFTLYDYKSTTLWDKDSNLPTPEEFWSSDTLIELSVGGKNDSDYKSFIEFLNKHQAKWNR